MTARKYANRLWLVAGWMATLVFTSLITWKTASWKRSPPGTVPARKPPAAEAGASEGGKGHLQRLQELLQANAKLKGAQECLMRKLALLENESRSLKASEQERQKILEAEASLRLDRLILAKQKGGEMFAGLEEMLDLLVCFAKAGEGGMDHLVRLARSAQTKEEREIALLGLALLPSPAGLRAILGTSSPGPFEDEAEKPAGGPGESHPDREPGDDAPAWSWDLVRRHIASLPTRDIEPYLSTFEDRLEKEPFIDQKTLEICALLALKHGSL